MDDSKQKSVKTKTEMPKNQPPNNETSKVEVENASNTLPVDKSSTNKPKPKKSCCFNRTVIIISIIVIILLGYRSFAFLGLGLFSDRESDLPVIPEEKPAEVKTEEKPADTTPTTNTKPSTQKPTATKTTPATSEPSIPGPVPNAPDMGDRMLEFFAEIAAYHINPVTETFSTRWTQSQIYVGGKPGENDLDSTYSQCLDWFVSDFNANSNSIKLIHNNELAEIKIYFMTRDELFEFKNGADYLPFASKVVDANGVVTAARMYFPNNQGYDDAEKCWSLKHEMMHAVGFNGHTDSVPDSEMTAGQQGLYITLAGLSEHDKRAIRMLYESGLPLKSNPSAIQAFFASHAY